MFTGQFISPLVFGPLMAATSITTGYLAAAGLATVLLLVLLGVRAPAPSTGAGGTAPHAAAATKPRA